MAQEAKFKRIDWGTLWKHETKLGMGAETAQPPAPQQTRVQAAENPGLKQSVSANKAAQAAMGNPGQGHAKSCPQPEQDQLLSW